VQIGATPLSDASGAGRRSARWLWGSAAALVAGALVAAALSGAGGRWSLALEVQKYFWCLPYTLYLVDHEVTRPPATGDLVRFVPPPNASRLAGPFEVVKIVAATAGTRWRIARDELYVDERPWGRLHLLRSLGLHAGALDGDYVVPAGHVLVLGTAPASYDSRYWGPLPVDRVRGYAHVVF
jgi:type IV secretory pathway protease TraF